MEFACGLDGSRAGAVSLRETDGGLRLEVDSPWGRVTYSQFTLVTVLHAVTSRSAAALYAVDHELAPFWCPTCKAVYCGAHWESWDVWDEGLFDQTRGRCPRGHERMLLD